LEIEVHKQLPYVIESWTETGKKGVLSSGKLKKRADQVEYWNLNKDPEGKVFRKKLGLKD